jgi:hypothetical protein
LKCFSPSPRQEAGTGPETIYVEIVDLVEPGDNTVARDRVQLYR